MHEGRLPARRAVAPRNAQVNAINGEHPAPVALGEAARRERQLSHCGSAPWNLRTRALSLSVTSTTSIDSP